MQYFGARYYHPILGRFISPDPVETDPRKPETFNRYVYANNSPYVYEDPEGRFWNLILGGISAMLSAYDGYRAYQSGGWNAAASSFGRDAALFAATGGTGKALWYGYNIWKAGRGAQIAAQVGREIGILRDAARGKGNFSLGSGTRAEADKLGRAWVGDDYKVASNGKALISKDGLRQYRSPAYKPRLDKTQANFQQRFYGQQSKEWQSNGHLDITE